MEAPPDATNPQTAPSASQRRLAGAVSLRELEDGERRRRHRHDRGRKKNQSLRLGVGGAVLLLLLTVGVVWRDINRKHFAAAEHLKYLGIQYELKKTEILRYAPLDERRERQARRELEQAVSGLASEQLVTQAEAVEEIREIIKPRYPMAKKRVRREFPDLNETFEISIEDSTVVINDLTGQYNEAAKTYNDTISAFPAAVIAPLFGFPAKLPPLRS
jgi:hypothetical protein